MNALLLVFMMSFAFAAEEADYIPFDFVMAKDNISEKYLAGAHLIYDCEEKHFVCVLAEDKRSCEEKRLLAMQKKEKFLPCAFIGFLPTKRSCFQRQLFLVSQAHGNRFCLNEKMKHEEPDYQ